MGNNCCKGDAAVGPIRSSSSIYSRSRAGASLDSRHVATQDANGVRLTISSAQTGDSGVYTLQASNGFGSDTARVRLEVSPEEAPTGDDPPTFLRRLQDLTVKVGTRTRFLVEIISSTECKVTWYRNERRLLEAERVALVRDGNFWCADIAAVSVDDLGRWTCTAENVGGRASCSAHLNVVVPKAYKRPEFVEELRAILTEQGTVSLECKVIGVPTPVLRWFKDSREIKAGDVFALTANADDPTSLGTYTCEAVNCMGRSYSSSKVHVVGPSREGSTRPPSSLSPEPPPIFTKELESKQIKICEQLNLSCHIVVPPWPRSVVWYNKEGKIEPSERYHVLEDGVGGYLLEVPSADFPDEGEWKCVATSSGGRVGISSCTVSMEVPKNYRKPRFMENLQAVLTEEGLVSFECKVVGFPTPVLSWFKDGQELKPGDVYQLTGTNSLGSYCCIARNCMGQASSSAELTVEDIQNQLNEEEKLQLFSKNQAPKFIEGLKSTEARIDEPFRFTVKVAIPPEPSLLWYRDDQPIDETPRTRLINESRGIYHLDLQNLEFMDQAEWKCVAMNDFGHSVTSCFLKLIIPKHYKKPRFLENLQAILSEEGAVNLECKVIGVPQPVLKWYKDGEELKPGDIHRIISGQDGTCCLGTYTCEAQNCMGIAASSASLLGFEDSIKNKAKKAEEALQRNLSLSTIHEERTSQMYDTPVGDITLDDKGEISFSFDGKEVSVSLYETPDLTEEEALQIVEMYADQLSENVSEHNVVELPPLRFVKETSTSGNLLMEAVIIDVSPDYFVSPEEDLRTEADIEDMSIIEENPVAQISLEKDLSTSDYIEKTMAMLSEEKSDFPKKMSRRKSESQISGEDFFSISQEHSSEGIQDDDTQIISESGLQSFASAKSSTKTVKASKKTFDEKTNKDIFKDESLKRSIEPESPIIKPKRERRRSRSSRQSSTESEKSFNKFKEELKTKEVIIQQEPIKQLATSPLKTKEEFQTTVASISSTLSVILNEIQRIEKDIVLKSESMSSAATASRSLEILNSLITPLTEVNSIADAIHESVIESKEVVTSLFKGLPQSLKNLQQNLTVLEKCIDVESDNRTLVKKTCVSFIEICGTEVQSVIKSINKVATEHFQSGDSGAIKEINLLCSEIINVLKISDETIKTKNLLDEANEIKFEDTNEVKHLKSTQKALFELRSPVVSLMNIAKTAETGRFVEIAKVKSSDVILNQMSVSIQDLQSALEQIESLSVKESTTNLTKYNTEIIETVMETVLKLRNSFELLSQKTTPAEDKIVLKQKIELIKQNLNEISAHINVIERNVGTLDILQSDNKLVVLQKMAQALITLENHIPLLKTIPKIKVSMEDFHKKLTKLLENVIEGNDAKKYFSLSEICDSIIRINTSMKKLDQELILSLASISNSLTIMQDHLINNLYEPELNCSLLSNISEMLITLEEFLNQAEEKSMHENLEQVKSMSFKENESSKANVIMQQIDHTIAAMENIKVLESAGELCTKLIPTIAELSPILEELKHYIASAKFSSEEHDENFSEFSSSTVTETIAAPLCELNHGIVTINQLIVENLESMKEDSILLTTVAEPLHELHNTLEILYQEVISQHGNEMTPYDVNVNFASAVQNINSCMVMIQECREIEAVDEISTLEDISGIKTMAEVLPYDEILVPATMETQIEQELQSLPAYEPILSIAEVLNNLNQHINVIQSPEIVETLETISELSDYSSLKSVVFDLSNINTGIEGILHPLIIENSSELRNDIDIQKLALIAKPIQELHQHLSVLDTHDLSQCENLLNIPSEKLQLNLQAIENFKNELAKCQDLLIFASPSTTSILHLKEACNNIIKILDMRKNNINYDTKQELILDSLSKTVKELLNLTYSEEIIVEGKLKPLVEKMYDEIFAAKEVILQFTSPTAENLAQEANFVQTISELQQNIVVIENIEFFDTSAISDITSCPSTHVANELNIDSFMQIDDIVENAVNVLQHSNHETPLADLMLVEDFLKNCRNEFTIINSLIQNKLTCKDLIRVLQEFALLQTSVNDYRIKMRDLDLSDHMKQILEVFLTNADECLDEVRECLTNVVRLKSDVLYKQATEKMINTSELLRVHLKNAAPVIKIIAHRFIEVFESTQNCLENIDIKILDELKQPYDAHIRIGEPERILFGKTEDLEYFLENQKRIQFGDSSVVELLSQLLCCLRNHQAYKDAIGTGKTLIIAKCLAECSDKLKEFVLNSGTQMIDEDKVEESEVKKLLTEMLVPLQAIHKQIRTAQEQIFQGTDENCISIDISTTESLIQTMTETHKKMTENYNFAESNISNKDKLVLMDVDKEVHALQNDLNSIHQLAATAKVMEVIEPMKIIEQSLHNILTSEMSTLNKENEMIDINSNINSLESALTEFINIQSDLVIVSDLVKCPKLVEGNAIAIELHNILKCQSDDLLTLNTVQSKTAKTKMLKTILSQVNWKSIMKCISQKNIITISKIEMVSEICYRLLAELNNSNPEKILIKDTKMVIFEEETKNLLQHIERYVAEDITETVEEITTVLKIDELKESMELARALRQNIECLNSAWESETTTEIANTISFQMQLAQQLHDSLSIVQVQAYEKSDNFPDIIKPESLHSITGIISELQDELCYVLDKFKPSEPLLTIDNKLHINNLQDNQSGIDTLDDSKTMEKSAVSTDLTDSKEANVLTLVPEMITSTIIPDSIAEEAFKATELQRSLNFTTELLRLIKFLTKKEIEHIFQEISRLTNNYEHNNMTHTAKETYDIISNSLQMANSKITENHCVSNFQKSLQFLHFTLTKDTRCELLLAQTTVQNLIKILNNILFILSMFTNKTCENTLNQNLLIDNVFNYHTETFIFEPHKEITIPDLKGELSIEMELDNQNITASIKEIIVAESEDLLYYDIDPDLENLVEINEENVFPQVFREKKETIVMNNVNTCLPKVTELFHQKNNTEDIPSISINSRGTMCKMISKDIYDEEEPRIKIKATATAENFEDTFSKTSFLECTKINEEITLDVGHIIDNDKEQSLFVCGTVTDSNQSQIVTIEQLGDLSGVNENIHTNEIMDIKLNETTESIAYTVPREEKNNTPIILEIDQFEISDNQIFEKYIDKQYKCSEDMMADENCTSQSLVDLQCESDIHSNIEIFTPVCVEEAIAVEESINDQSKIKSLKPNNSYDELRLNPTSLTRIDDNLLFDGVEKDILQVYKTACATQCTGDLEFAATTINTCEEILIPETYAKPSITDDQSNNELLEPAISYDTPEINSTAITTYNKIQDLAKEEGKLETSYSTNEELIYTGPSECIIFIKDNEPSVLSQEIENITVDHMTKLDTKNGNKILMEYVSKSDNRYDSRINQHGNAMLSPSESCNVNDIIEKQNNKDEIDKSRADEVFNKNGPQEDKPITTGEFIFNAELGQPVDLLQHLEELTCDEFTDIANKLADATEKNTLQQCLNIALELKEHIKATKPETEPDNLQQNALLLQQLCDLLAVVQNTTLNSTLDLESEINDDDIQKFNEVKIHLQEDLSSLNASYATQSIEEQNKCYNTSEDSLQRLDVIVKDINEKLNESSQDLEKINELRDCLDEVQTIIIKLRHDYDGIENENFNEIIEDLECSVRSVQLQINESCPPDLLKEACVTLHLLVKNLCEMDKTQFLDITFRSTNKTDQILENCFDGTENTVELLENATQIKLDSTHKGLHQIIKELDSLRKTMQSLKLLFLGNAESIIEKGVEINNSLQDIEDKVYILEKKLSEEEIQDHVTRDNILTALHSVFSCISNMRGTITSIQKQSLYESYGKPCEYLLKSIRNITLIIKHEEYDEQKEKMNSVTTSLRNLLIQFEDIKFYVNLDKTARFPSNTQKTISVIESLLASVTDAILLYQTQNNEILKENINDLVEELVTDLKNVDCRPTLEVKEKIPIFKNIAVKVFHVTEEILSHITKIQKEVKPLDKDKENVINIEPEKQLNLTEIEQTPTQIIYENVQTTLKTQQICNLEPSSSHTTNQHINEEPELKSKEKEFSFIPENDNHTTDLEECSLQQMEDEDKKQPEIENQNPEPNYETEEPTTEQYKPDFVMQDYAETSDLNKYEQINNQETDRESKNDEQNLAQQETAKPEQFSFIEKNEMPEFAQEEMNQIQGNDSSTSDIEHKDPIKTNNLQDNEMLLDQLMFKDEQKDVPHMSVKVIDVKEGTENLNLIEKEKYDQKSGEAKKKVVPGEDNRHFLDKQQMEEEKKFFSEEKEQIGLENELTSEAVLEQDVIKAETGTISLVEEKKIERKEKTKQEDIDYPQNEYDELEANSKTEETEIRIEEEQKPEEKEKIKPDNIEIKQKEEEESKAIAEKEEKERHGIKEEEEKEKEDQASNQNKEKEDHFSSHSDQLQEQKSKIQHVELELKQKNEAEVTLVSEIQDQFENQKETDDAVEKEERERLRIEEDLIPKEEDGKNTIVENEKQKQIEIKLKDESKRLQLDEDQTLKEREKIDQTEIEPKRKEEKERLLIEKNQNLEEKTQHDEENDRFLINEDQKLKEKERSEQETIERKQKESVERKAIDEKLEKENIIKEELLNDKEKKEQADKANQHKTEADSKAVLESKPQAQIGKQLREEKERLCIEEDQDSKEKKKNEQDKMELKQTERTLEESVLVKEKPDEIENQLKRDKERVRMEEDRKLKEADEKEQAEMKIKHEIDDKRKTTEEKEELYLEKDKTLEDEEMKEQVITELKQKDNTENNAVVEKEKQDEFENQLKEEKDRLQINEDQKHEEKQEQEKIEIKQKEEADRKAALEKEEKERLRIEEDEKLKEKEKKERAVIEQKRKEEAGRKVAVEKEEKERLLIEEEQKLKEKEKKEQEKIKIEETEEADRKSTVEKEEKERLRIEENQKLQEKERKEQAEMEQKRKEEADSKAAVEKEEKERLLIEEEQKLKEKEKKEQEKIKIEETEEADRKTTVEKEEKERLRIEEDQKLQEKERKEQAEMEQKRKEEADSKAAVEKEEKDSSVEKHQKLKENEEKEQAEMQQKRKEEADKTTTRKEEKEKLRIEEDQKLKEQEKKEQEKTEIKQKEETDKKTAVEKKEMARLRTEEDEKLKEIEKKEQEKKEIKQKEEADRKAALEKEEKERLRIEEDEKLKEKENKERAEMEQKRKEEADKKTAVEKEEKARLRIEEDENLKEKEKKEQEKKDIKQKEEADRKAALEKEEKERFRIEEEQKLKEKQEQEKIEIKQKEEADRKAAVEKEEKERLRIEEDKKLKEKKERAETEQKQKEEADRKAAVEKEEKERLRIEEDEKLKEKEKKERAEIEQKRKEEAGRKAAVGREEIERLRIEEEQKLKEKEKKQRAETEQKQKEEADRKAAVEKEEKERLRIEEDEKLKEKEKKERVEIEQKRKEEAGRKAAVEREEIKRLHIEEEQKLKEKEKQEQEIIEIKENKDEEREAIAKKEEKERVRIEDDGKEKKNQAEMEQKRKEEAEVKSAEEKEEKERLDIEEDQQLKEKEKNEQEKKEIKQNEEADRKAAVEKEEKERLRIEEDENLKKKEKKEQEKKEIKQKEEADRKIALEKEEKERLRIEEEQKLKEKQEQEKIEIKQKEEAERKAVVEKEEKARLRIEEDQKLKEKEKKERVQMEQKRIEEAGRKAAVEKEEKERLLIEEEQKLKEKEKKEQEKIKIKQKEEAERKAVVEKEEKARLRIEEDQKLKEKEKEERAEMEQKQKKEADRKAAVENEEKARLRTEEDEKLKEKEKKEQEKKEIKQKEESDRKAAVENEEKARLRTEEDEKLKEKEKKEQEKKEIKQKEEADRKATLEKEEKEEKERLRIEEDEKLKEKEKKERAEMEQKQKKEADRKAAVENEEKARLRTEEDEKLKEKEKKEQEKKEIKRKEESDRKAAVENEEKARLRIEEDQKLKEKEKNEQEKIEIKQKEEADKKAAVEKEEKARLRIEEDQKLKEKEKKERAEMEQKRKEEADINAALEKKERLRTEKDRKLKEKENKEQIEMEQKRKAEADRKVVLEKENQAQILNQQKEEKERLCLDKNKNLKEKGKKEQVDLEQKQNEEAERKRTKTDLKLKQIPEQTSKIKKDEDLNSRTSKQNKEPENENEFEKENKSWDHKDQNIQNFEEDVPTQSNLMGKNDKEVDVKELYERQNKQQHNEKPENLQTLGICNRKQNETYAESTKKYSLLEDTKLSKTLHGNNSKKREFIDHTHVNYTEEFARPSSFREHTIETDTLKITNYDCSVKTYYKVDNLMRDAQLRSSLPRETDMKKYVHKRDKGYIPKAVSEISISPSDKRLYISRDSKRKPIFSTYLTDRTAVEGSRVKLTCSVLSVQDPKITWFKNGAPLNNQLKYKTKYIDGLITLEVLNAVPDDTAEYSCTVENDNGSVNSAANLKVYPSFEATPIPPTFTRSIRDTYHLAENELILECRIRGQPLPSISWLKDNKEIETVDRFQSYYLADGVCRLAINSPSPKDSGKYTCKAENSIWSDQISHDVNFTGKEVLSPNITTLERSRFTRHAKESRRPHFSNVLSDHSVVSGGTIGLQVEIRGLPSKVEWLREGHPVTEAYQNARTFVEQSLYTLALSDVTERESGTYTCRAYSSHGSVDMNASVTVLPSGSFKDGKPATIVGRPEKDVLISIGEDLNISFRVQGEPKPKVYFLKGTRDITSSHRVCKMTSDDYVKFTLKRSVVSDAGTYCIYVRNAYGCDRAFVTVVVRQRASSEHLVSDWTYPLDDIVVAVTERTNKAVPERIPSEPIVVDGGNNWATLTWPKPDPRASAPVLAYKLESWQLGKEGGARWNELGITPLNTYDIFNLKEGEEYYFRVTPRNRYGWGESVQTSTPVGIGLSGDRPEFLEILPGQLKVLVGETATLKCSVKGKPLPEIVWMKNGHEIEEQEGKIMTTFNGQDCVLIIKNVKLEDEARYSCEASNNHGRASSYARVSVVTDPIVWEADAKLKRERSSSAGDGEYPPQFTMRLRDRRVQATYPVRLTCQVVGSPSPVITWYKDAQEIKEDGRHSKSQDEHFHTLEIAPTSLEDGGVYEAMARNGRGAVSCRCNLVVDKGIRAYIAPEFCCGLDPLYRLNEGDELRIAAVVEAYPSVGVTWYRDGVRLRPSRRAIMTLDRDGVVELALASVTSRDAGVYTCTASNEVGRASTSGKVEVLETDQPRRERKPIPSFVSPDFPYSKEPMFIRKPRSSEAWEGDTVIIQCEVVGDPKPDVYWLRDFLKPDYYRDAIHFKRIGDGPEYRLEIPHAKLDYTGAYSVVARNEHGEAKAIISLQILAKDSTCTDDTHNIRYGRVDVIPRFQKELTDLLCCDGDAVEFECQVEAEPEPDVKWYRYGELIKESNEFELTFDGTTARLKIKQVTGEDEGMYSCEASNTLGKTTSTACLVVYQPGEPNTLSQQMRRPPALLSAQSTPRSTPRCTPARSVSRTPGPDHRQLYSPSRQISPKFYTYPHNKVVEEGGHARFQCAVTGHPMPWTSWDKDGVIITPSTRITIKEKDDLRILEIEEVTIEDAGLYRITLENDYGRIEAAARLDVISHKGKFHAGVRAYSASPRRAVTYKKFTTATSSRQNYDHSLDYKYEASGSYNWTKHNDCYEEYSSVSSYSDDDHEELVFTEVVDNEMDDNLPKLSMPDDVVTTKGASVLLKVQFEGEPQPSVIWSKDNVEICVGDSEWNRFHIETRDSISILEISNVTENDDGFYTVSLKNEYGVACGETRVTVEDIRDSFAEGNDITFNDNDEVAITINCESHDELIDILDTLDQSKKSFSKQSSLSELIILDKNGKLCDIGKNGDTRFVETFCDSSRSRWQLRAVHSDHRRGSWMTSEARIGLHAIN